jgi:hypothetical protein
MAKVKSLQFHTADSTFLWGSMSGKIMLFINVPKIAQKIVGKVIIVLVLTQ